jgi:hypothetical protein
MTDLDKIEALNANTEALNANTEAMSRLAVVWEKLHAKAVQIESNPEHTGIQAAGVPIAKFPAPVTEPAPTTPFVL